MVRLISRQRGGPQTDQVIWDWRFSTCKGFWEGSYYNYILLFNYYYYTFIIVIFCNNTKEYNRYNSITCNILFRLLTVQALQLHLFILYYLHYSGIPISRILSFSNLPITRTKSCFPSLVQHCNFTPDFSSSPIFRTSFRFPWRFVKSGFHCI